MTTRLDDLLMVKGQSLIGIETLSHNGAANQNWSGFSLTAFNPRYALTPGSSATHTNEFLMTLVMTLLKPRT